MADAPEVTDLTHKRDGDGELLPVEKTVDVRGEGTATLKVIPATAGQRNRWTEKFSEQPDELKDGVRDEMFDEFLPYEPGDFEVDEWGELRPALEDAISNAIFDAIFDRDDFVGELQERIDERTGNAETAD